jgi:Neprosin
MGGETVGYPHWPPMGSGKFASGGYRAAAYNREIQYRDSANGGHSPTLTVSEPSPACWTATSSPGAGGSNWRTFFYFGGPGGKFGTC